MNVILLGYMGSGKSFIGQELSKTLQMPFIDFDGFIEENERSTINEIFDTKGEIYFRKIEHHYLKALLNKSTNSIIALGGGTPCYYDNMQIIKSRENTKVIYINVSVAELSKRLLKEKQARPLLKYVSSIDDMEEFVGKHLFERINFYNQADIIINGNNSPEKIIEEIVLRLF
ncbi:shikimate kinase [Hanstruepera neustonica]|uniref:Shikimate kinase n=1 Tax=Hanstruepera neustonica TaxID=1445657 RepID=A0A2K1DZ27_9FLAO|nr:shikimate kinase [Hanstruepera neustonica]PNQ73271.1 shikimate kinase [Hanstruepera neustonica]